MKQFITSLSPSLLSDANIPQDIRLSPQMKELPISSAPQYTLYRLIRELRPKKILEIGTQGGCSAVAMAYAMRDNGMEVDITCIDPFLPTGDNDGLSTLSEWYKNVSESGYLEKGIRLMMTTSQNYLPFTKHQFDFIVIDGSHHYEDVKYDFIHSLPICELGGYVWLHDFEIYESVRRACCEVVVQKQLRLSPNHIQTNARGDVCGWALVQNLPYHHLRFVQNQEININIGCGADYQPDCINIDRDPNVRSDISTDYTNIDQLFAPQSIASITLNHSIGYLPIWEAQDFFKKAKRLLKPGGKLVIETPNILKAIEKIQTSVASISNGEIAEYIEGVRAFHAFGVDDMQTKNSYTPYSLSWSPEHIKHELQSAEFSQIKILPPQTHSMWRDMRVEAVV